MTHLYDKEVSHIFCFEWEIKNVLARTCRYFHIGFTTTWHSFRNTFMRERELIEYVCRLVALTHANISIHTRARVCVHYYSWKKGNELACVMQWFVRYGTEAKITSW